MTRHTEAVFQFRRRWHLGSAWLLVPALTFLALVYLFPLTRLAIVSFQSPVGPLGHYRRIFDTPVYLRSLRNTVEIAVTVSAFCLLLAYPTAVALSTASARVRAILGVLIVLPYFVAVLVRTYAVMVVLGTNGPINSALRGLGLIQEPHRLLFTRGAVILAMTIVLIPLMVLPISSVMAQIDPNLVRAAQALGAGPTAAFWRVYFPLSVPGVLAGVILVFVLSLGFFITPALVGGPTDRVLAQDIANQARLLTSEGFSQALAVVLLVVTLVILTLASRVVHFDLIWGMVDSQRTRYRLRSAPSGMAFFHRVSEHLVDVIGWPALRVLGALPHAVGHLFTRIVTTCVLVGAMVPIGLVVIMSFTSSVFLVFPPPGFSLRWYGEFLSNQAWIQAGVNSVVIGGLTAVVSVALGTTAALGLARSQIPGKSAIVGFILSPLIVPAVVAALSLYWVLLRLNLAGSIPVVVAAHTLGGLPMVVLIVSATYQMFDTRLERAALSLGATPWRSFWYVIFPLIRPGLFVAAFFAFLYSFDELVYTLFVRSPRLVTLPIKLWGDLNFGLTPVLAVVSTVEIGVVVLVLGLSFVIGVLGRRGRQRRTI
jgi:putative spermidine/putrescine transport system permease protein